MSRFPGDFLSLNDFEQAARSILPRPLYAYVSGAVEDECSLRLNRQAFAEYAFQPRFLIDVSKRDQSVTLFGQTCSSPAGIAPMGLSALTSYRGDIVMAQAAQARRMPCIMSGSSLIRLEEVMEAAPDTWFQAYLPGHSEQIEALIERVARARVNTLVITVDMPVPSNRENNIRAGFSTPLRPGISLGWQGVTHPRWLFSVFMRTLLNHGMPHFENNYATRGAPVMSRNVLRDFSDRGHLCWEHIAAVRKRWKGAMVLKGILSPHDALKARQLGMDGVIVSNHGGRQLDGSLSPLQALPAIVDAVPDLTVMLDSGVRRGTDVLKAMALGAKAVFIGRPFNYAAAVAGHAGVAHALKLIHDEISRDMGMLGITRLEQLTAQYLFRLGTSGSLQALSGQTSMSESHVLDCGKAPAGA